MNLLAAHIDQIKAICASNKVRTLFAFGSVTNNKFKADSDVDMVVDIAETDPLAYSESYFKLKEQLEAIFNRQVDLLEQKSIKNPFLKKEIDQTKILIYGI
jgi:predicted nucleotidyltransferase